MAGKVIKSNIIKGDTVQLRRGKEKGKRGVVRSVHPKDGMAVVEGLNLVKRHTKPNMGGSTQGGIIEKEMPIPLSALMVVDPKTSLPTRVRRVRNKDGAASVRVAVRSGEELLSSEKGR
jgi:large subunit ribosomal protein L24